MNLGAPPLPVSDLSDSLHVESCSTAGTLAGEELCEGRGRCSDGMQETLVVFQRVCALANDL